MKNPKTLTINRMTRTEINTHLRSLRKLLQQVLSGNLDIPYGCSNLGICFHWKKLMEREFTQSNSYSYRVVEELAIDWPHTVRPGEIVSCPVPLTGQTWKGKGLELRISLMRYMIKRLRDRLRRMP